MCRSSRRIPPPASTESRLATTNHVILTLKTWPEHAFTHTPLPSQQVPNRQNMSLSLKDPGKIHYDFSSCVLSMCLYSFLKKDFLNGRNTLSVHLSKTIRPCTSEAQLVACWVFEIQNYHMIRVSTTCSNVKSTMPIYRGSFLHGRAI